MKRLALFAAVLGAATACAVLLGASGAGARTTTPALVAGSIGGVEVVPIISTGDTLAGGFVFESIPDGIAVNKLTANRAELYVNHELSLVPFPVGVSDFGNAMLSKLTFDRGSRDVSAGRYVIPSEANFQRFCSNFLATTVHGFGRPIVL